MSTPLGKDGVARATTAIALLLFFGLAIWLGLGAGRFLMIDQGDYVRTVKRLVVAPEDPVALPHSAPVGHRWILEPFPDWKLRVYRGSATPVLALSALPARLGSGVLDTRHSALAFTLLLAVILWGIAGRVAPDRPAWQRAVMAAPALLLVMGAHNAAFLGSFYAELPLILSLPLLVLALLLPPGRAASLLLFLAAAGAATAKAPFFYLPAVVAIGLWWFREPHTRRGLWVALALAQAFALLVLFRGELTPMNAHHSTFLGSSYYLTPAELVARGLPVSQIDCVGVDYWGNQTPSPTSTDIRPAPTHCADLPERDMTDAVTPYLAHPLLLWRLAKDSLPVHARADYFHLSPSALYRHMVAPTLATRLMDTVSRWRDGLLQGFGLPVALSILLITTLLPLGARLGPARRPLVLLAAFGLSQVPVALGGEGVRDLGKHLAAAQFSLDLALGLLTMVLAAFVLRTRRETDLNAPGV